MLWEILVCGAAGGLPSRAVFWHVPKLAAMVWRGWIDERRRGGWDADYTAHHKAEYDEPLQVLPRVDMDLWETKAFIDCPSAFWLEPTRWERKTWPATPVVSDLTFDGSVNDKALAFAVLTGPERLSLAEQRDINRILAGPKARISSKSNFDRRY